jgi:acyl-coenzyme A synthetase/AMP-(fatty) acid ligase
VFVEAAGCIFCKKNTQLFLYNDNDRYTFDYNPGDVYLCTSDCGWITGHSYVTYGPLLNRATQVFMNTITKLCYI